MRRYLHILTFCLVALLSGCTPESGPDDGMVHFSYAESEKVFANPERGFYSAIDFYSETASPITSVKMIANRAVNRTLFYTGYYLTDFMESDISPAYLQLIRTNMQALRDGGFKCVLRFAYKTDMSEAGHPWDASPEWVHRHIEQVKPILQEYGDVILCLQAGFIGVWGEWAYTDHFVARASTPEEYALRKEVTSRLLDALPKDRQVALRTPMFKRMMFLDSYADTLTLETAYKETDAARLCGHNDCFGVNASDAGTFTGTETRTFWKSDTRYVMMGGETCGVSDFCLCERSLKDMEDYHWTYLNSGYNSNVLNRWKADGCYEEVERRLGYRLSLEEVSYTADATAGNDFRIILKIRNTGFAAPVNPRSAEFILQDGSGRRTVYELNDIDLRYWFAGETVTIDRTIRLPADAAGECILYLNLPDPEETLHDNPLFSIRLANDGIWNKEAGCNRVAGFML